MRSAWQTLVGRIAAAAAVVGIAGLSACSSNKKPPPAARNVTPTAMRDVPAPLRGTIGAQGTVRGMQPTLVSGIGFVVGLDGTGGQPLRTDIAATLERYMGLMGIGESGRYEGTAIAGKSPRELLEDPNTAAVIVQAAIPPGASKGSTFDVWVRALNADSLEGGRLWSTDLRLGPPSSFGAPQARILARARGPIFINPFAEPGSEVTGVSGRIGRILDGGEVTEELMLEVILDRGSHAQAMQVQNAINSRFRGDLGDIRGPARGQNDRQILVEVPPTYRDRPGDFANMLVHLQTNTSSPELFARQYAAVLASTPELANEMSWCLQALGPKALPFLRDLYRHPEAAPRLAALRAGAGLGDPYAADPLVEIATNGPEALRSTAIRLLGRVDAGPTIDESLRSLLNDEQLTTRVAAYEALLERAISVKRQRLASAERDRAAAGGVVRFNRTAIDVLAESSLPPGMIQGVSRSLVGGEFFLDIAPAGEPLIYVTQQGEPRVALFGREPLMVEVPALVSLWNNDLMITGDDPNGPLRIRYNDARRGFSGTYTVDRDLPSLLDFLTRDWSPDRRRSGLGLSYARVVSVLHALHRAGAIRAAFATERDRLLADLLAASESNEVEVRPETDDDSPELIVIDDPRRAPTRPVEPVLDEDGQPTLIVPIPPQSTEQPPPARRRR